MGNINHNWNITPGEAIQIQKRLSARVQLSNTHKHYTYVAGTDVSIEQSTQMAIAGIVVIQLPALIPVAYSYAVSKIKFPYIPGLLSFREIPALLQAWKNLNISPGLVMMDGQGIAHPRRFGIACHFGLCTEVPSLGIAKKKLSGNYKEPDTYKGACQKLETNGEHLGYILRTRAGTKPVYISPGHLIDHENSLYWVKKCMGRYRIPEPTRQAHLYVNQIRKKQVAT